MLVCIYVYVFYSCTIAVPLRLYKILLIKHYDGLTKQGTARILDSEGSSEKLRMPIVIQNKIYEQYLGNLAQLNMIFPKSNGLNK